MSSRRGFTLIEVMAAMAIFAIGILALAGLQARYIGDNAAARMQTEATAVATAYLEWLRALPYEDPVLRPTGSRHVYRGAYRISWTVRADEILSGTKTLHVTVTPGNSRSGGSVRLSTLIAGEP